MQATVVLVLVRGDTEVASWPVTRPWPPDLTVVDELARLQLAAQRVGFSLRVRGACDHLCELLDLVGLADVVRRDPAALGDPAARALAVEVGGEPEDGEEVRVEEGVEARDPPA